MSQERNTSLTSSKLFVTRALSVSYTESSFQYRLLLFGPEYSNFYCVKSAHAAHDPEDIVIDCIHANLGAPAVAGGARRQLQVQSSIVDTRHVAGARWLMLLGLKTKGVDIDTLLGDILVVLVGLHQIEVATIALGEPVVTVELQLGSNNWVITVLEGDGNVNSVGTTSGNTGHSTSIASSGSSGRSDQVGEGSGVSATRGLGGGGGVGVVIVVGVVEPLLALGSRVRHVQVTLDDPDQLLARMVEVQLDLVLLLAGGLVTSELQLLNQVLVRDLSEPAALIGIQVDVVDEQGARRHSLHCDGVQVGGPSSARVGGGGCPNAVLPLTELKVDLDLVVLESD